MSTSNDAVWIVSDGRPFKYNESAGRFEVKGERKAEWIFAGSNGQALMRGKDKHEYEWAEDDKFWVPRSKNTFEGAAYGSNNRLYKITGEDEVFQ